MAEQALVQYIKSNLSRGSSLEEITQKLKSEGWPEFDIEDAIEAASIQMQSSRKASGKLWLIIIVTTIVVGIGAMAASSVFFFGNFHRPADIGNMTELEYCQGETGVYRALCYTDLARAEDDISICNHLMNTDERKYKDICIRDYAVGKSDYDTCDIIENSYIRDQCIEWIDNKEGG